MRTLPQIEDLDDPFDPYASDEAMFGDDVDPYEPIAAARAHAPVIPGTYHDVIGRPAQHLHPEESAYTVLSYAAVDQVVSDPATFSNQCLAPTLGAIFGPVLTVMDPPDHTQSRRVLQRAFRPSIVQEWGAEFVDPVLDDLLARVEGRERLELVSELTRPFPFQVIYRMLGLPPDDIETFYRLTIAQLDTSNGMRRAKEAATKLGNYFRALLQDRAERPGPDLVSKLAALELSSDPLSEEVTIAFLRQLMSAGGESTYRAVSTLLAGLLTNVDQLEAVRADRSLVPDAVEEALRWEGPVMAVQRSTTRDVVVDGVALPAGAHLDVLVGSANHDPAVFERPDEFDLFRPKQRHFGFAFGVHNCIGQVLARLEMTRALHALLDRLPTARLDPDRPAPLIRGATMRFPREIHVRLD